MEMPAQANSLLAGAGSSFWACTKVLSNMMKVTSRIKKVQFLELGSSHFMLHMKRSTGLAPSTATHLAKHRHAKHRHAPYQAQAR
eukprot:1160202-Pelagomonas_calceolata.AAC.13